MKTYRLHNDEDIQPFESPYNFVSPSGQTDLMGLLGACISLYKSCEVLKGKCLSLEIRLTATVNELKELQDAHDKKRTKWIQNLAPRND
jgi:hypothetical protein